MLLLSARVQNMLPLEGATQVRRIDVRKRSGAERMEWNATKCNETGRNRSVKGGSIPCPFPGVQRLS